MVCRDLAWTSTSDATLSPGKWRAWRGYASEGDGVTADITENGRFHADLLRVARRDAVSTFPCGSS
jgi:hypothetical protein